MRQPSPTTTPPALRPAWVSHGGSREGQEANCGGEGAPRPAPQSGFLFSRQTVPTGFTLPGPGRLPAGGRGPGLVEVAGVGLRVFAMAWGRG